MVISPDGEVTEDRGVVAVLARGNELRSALSPTSRHDPHLVAAHLEPVEARRGARLGSGLLCINLWS